MAHYFEDDPNIKDAPQAFGFSLLSKDFSLLSTPGLFSYDKLDTGTRLLLETVLKEQAPAKSVLDLGCGCGVIGIVLEAFWHCSVTFSDINPRACRLCTMNLEKEGVDAKVECMDGVPAGSYDCILLNPPIHTGKQSVYALLESCCKALDENGTFWIVIRKQHGAKSAMEFMESLHMQVERAARDKGFWIVKINHSK